LRNPVAGRYTHLERVTNFLRDHVWGGAGQSTFRSWTQADFSLCLTPNIGCIQNTYPWLDMTARANGTAGGSVG